MPKQQLTTASQQVSSESSMGPSVGHWLLRNTNGVEMAGTLTESIGVNDPAAMREVARHGTRVDPSEVADE